MFLTVKLKKAIFATALCAMVVFAAVLISNCGDSVETSAAEGKAVLVIDPGHGGIDGGAVGVNGSHESGINLAIGQKMQKLAALYGFSSIMTRENDDSNVSADEYSERGELLRRAEIANSTPNAVLVSIHQNKFPTGQPAGAQVMYAASEGSRRLGLLAQDALVSFADASNRRVASPAPDKLLLTSSVNCPAILAECGFLSNPDECAKLSQPEYQTKLACALTAAYIQFAAEHTTT